MYILNEKTRAGPCGILLCRFASEIPRDSTGACPYMRATLLFPAPFDGEGGFSLRSRKGNAVNQFSTAQLDMYPKDSVQKIRLHVL